MVDNLIYGLPGLVAVQYLAVSVLFFYRKDYGFSLTYFAYALANVGLILASMK